MSLRSPRFIGFALLMIILCGGSLIYGLLWGIPQWTAVFQGALDPLMAAYDGWSFSLGFVAAGVFLVGGCVALSWFRATFDYLLLGIGFVAVLVFVALGFPVTIAAQIDAALSFVMVGLCAILVAGVFFTALKDRLTRRYRV